MGGQAGVINQLEISDEEAEKIRTIRDIVDYIDGHEAERA